MPHARRRSFARFFRILPILFILLTMALTLANAGDEGASQAAKPCPLGADLWLLAGQSNMQGCGKLKRQIPDNPKIVMFNMDNTWMVAREPVHRLFEAAAPIHAQYMMQGGMTTETLLALREASRKNPSGGVGPGLSFANCVFKVTGRPIGLIPSAHGGTSMAQWDPALKAKGDDSLYGATINRIKTVGGMGKLKGVLWYQGESDASAEASAVYEQKLLGLIDALRADTGQPDLPFFIVQIGRYVCQNREQNPWYERVRDIERRVASLRKNVYVTTAIDQDLDDLIHVSYEGQQALGRRLAELALTYGYKKPGHGKMIDLESVKVLAPDADGTNTIRLRFSGVSGRLRAVGRPGSFELRSAKPDFMSPVIYRVDFDPQDPAALNLQVIRALAGTTTTLTCGPGLDPFMNIVDGKNMPIPTFGPMPVPKFEGGAK